MNNYERFVGVFGKREIELAAMRIVDEGMVDTPVTRGLMRTDYERHGFDLLVEARYLVPVPFSDRFTASETFKTRTRNAIARDAAERA